MTAAAETPWLQPGTAVFSRTVPWPQSHLLAFLRRATGNRRFFWESARSGAAFSGFGAAAVLTAEGPDRFGEIQRQARQLFERTRILPADTDLPAAAGPRLVGGFSFLDQLPVNGIWSAFRPAFFVLPRYQLQQIAGQTYLTVNVAAPEDDLWAAHEALWELPAPLDIPILDADPAEVVSEDLMDHGHWLEMVAAAVGAIRAGRFEKVVLARAREIPGMANPLAALARLSSRYPDTTRFLVEAAPGRAFFGATPELLVHVRPGCIETMALAGSIRRGDSLAEDEALGDDLLNSHKNGWEHRLVADAVAERLAPFVETVQRGQTGLLKLSNIQHLFTPIFGTPRALEQLLDIVAALHPTPAVGGLPSAAALDRISEAETVSRGWYAGPVGWMDPAGNGEFVVALRSAVTDGSRSRLYAGAGIVSESDPEKEWQETQWKFKPMMESLGCAEAR